MTTSSERERIAVLARVLGAADARVPVGIGDDAAVLAPDLVWTVDAQVDGTHFRLDWLSWEDVGWRSFMAAASDLAAMGAAPLAALSSLILAPSVGDAALEALARGQRAAADEVGAPVVGGNLARGRETSITTTLLGRTERAVLRSGARPGDSVWLAGEVGVAARGLRALESGNMQDASIAAWRRPRALVAEGLAMAKVATAAVDISDGLAGDLAHLAEASGVRIELEGLADDALFGGEDYALAVTSPVPIDGFRRIGAVVSGPPEVRVDGRALAARGFDHFAK